MDPIFLASAVTTWVLNKLLDSLKDATIKALLGTEGLTTEVKDLVHALDRANLIIGSLSAGAAAGVKLGNQQLGPQITEVQHLAVKLAKHIDKLQYYDLGEKVKKTNLKDCNQLTSKMMSLALTGQSKGKIKKSDLQDMGHTVNSLHKICDIVHNALLLEKLDKLYGATQNTSTDVRETVENSTETKKFEREEKAGIVNTIIASASSDHDLLVLPIVGDGGVGKTTLARLVYLDPQVKAQFDIKIWIYVSANFDEIKLSHGILEHIAPDWEYTSTKNLNVLQLAIKKHLQRKRFLLVLDDMWEESQGRWDNLLAPLRCTDSKGNVILVTTRKLSVANITGKMENHIQLNGMDGAIFWRFFKTCIFGYEKCKGQGKLQNIGKKIAAKLNGNPLAAKSVAALLRRNLKEVYWNNILNRDEWKLQNAVDDIIPALKISYNHLPYHLQQLFSYCSLFPKGFKFDKEQLIRMWIALGFVIDERKELEDAGSDNFDDLVDRSFFHRDEQYFIVHDLMHDVAQEVALHECLNVDGSDPLNVFKSIRHVGIWTDWTESVYKEQIIERHIRFEQKLDAIVNKDILKTLESLMLVGVYDENFSEKFVGTLKKLSYVQILRLSVMPFNVDVLLSSVEKFIHLRYLELRYSSDKHKPLPDAICNLYHLMVLDITHWSGLNDLPKYVSNLLNLRHLLVPGSGSLHSKIARVGQLKFLQELKEFQVQQGSGFEISQLEELNEIKGSLSILGLENVKNYEQARSARIEDKTHLRTLSLSWGEYRDVQKEVMEGLKPNVDLAHLHVVNYASATPTWLGNVFSLSNLESLQLQDCTGMETLPPFEELQFLKKLSLIGMSSLKDVSIDFNYDDENTVAQSYEEDELELSEVEIIRCSSLTTIRLHSCTALTNLTIKDCGALSFLEGLPSSGGVEYNVKECPQLAADAISN
ncbi:hypothetical protein QYE76_058778 [Lolium multiflorum]|uniref:NB-ARC domain-containing protein n=1 Tax=Lolium multiflorum TaxID=4521 RepID=A0AAD8T758_LOLMU|nr:hypothetical protein QYE76_058778 [Lolium multiflorum]